MKNVLLYIILVVIGSSMQHQAFGQKSGKILEGKIRVAVIESVPTRPEEQRPGQDYIFDYHVLHYLSLSKEQAEQLKTLINNRTGFDEKNVKSCLFQPGYAIVGATKRKWFPLYLKFRGEVIVSTGTCGKAIVMKNGSEQYFDLGQNNALEQFLTNLN